MVLCNIVLPIWGGGVLYKTGVSYMRWGCPSTPQGAHRPGEVPYRVGGSYIRWGGFPYRVGRSCIGQGAPIWSGGSYKAWRDPI